MVPEDDNCDSGVGGMVWMSSAGRMACCDPRYPAGQNIRNGNDHLHGKYFVTSLDEMKTNLVK